MSKRKHIHVRKHSNEEMQQKFVEYELYRKGIDSLAHEISLVNSTINNLMTAKSTLEVVRNLKENNEILVPIGGNIFIKASVKEKDRVLTGISSELLLLKDIKSTIETINTQVGELTVAREKMEGRIRELSKKMAKLEPILKEFGEELRKKARK